MRAIASEAVALVQVYAICTTERTPQSDPREDRDVASASENLGN
jgi:hypothetical protein